MWAVICKFWSENWQDLSLILVGLVAVFIYWLQERKKISEAASLVVMQIEDLQKRMREISSFITEGKLDDVSFYESQILYQTDYWDQYRHYLIRRLDATSLGTIDDFFRCAAEVREQQELMKNLQKNFFFQKQQMILQLEYNYILQDLQISNQTTVNKGALTEGLMETVPSNMKDEQKQAMKNMLQQLADFGTTTDLNTFWNLYRKDQADILTITDQNAFTRFNPGQITISLEKALKQYASIPVIGCPGYNKLKKLAERKF